MRHCHAMNLRGFWRQHCGRGAADPDDSADEADEEDEDSPDEDDD